MASNEIEVNEIQQAYAEGHKDGRKAKTAEVITWAKNRICFDNRDNGECDHSSCYELKNLITELNNL
jgi:hypothetical protein